MGCAASTAADGTVTMKVTAPKETEQQRIAREEREKAQAAERQALKDKITGAKEALEDKVDEVKEEAAARKAAKEAEDAKEEEERAKREEERRKQMEVLKENVAHTVGDMQNAATHKVDEVKEEVAARKAAKEAEDAKAEEERAAKKAALLSALNGAIGNAEKALADAKANAAAASAAATQDEGGSVFDFSYDDLKKQDDNTSAKVIALLDKDPRFQQLAKAEGEALLLRDAEDGAKLQAGIDIAIAKGVLPKLEVAPINVDVDVLGKSAQTVAEEIIASVKARQAEAGAAPDAAVALVLTGLSGTGKGTTTAKLQQLLPKAMTWSNGNVFRSFTYMLNEAFEATNPAPNAELTAAFITPERVAEAARRLSFDKFGDEYDVVIDGAIRVSAIANTDLKAPKVALRVPTVAEQTQGEVIAFAAKAVATLQSAGHNVILEGRAQTLNYIPTPYRYTLIASNVDVLGARRAAQRIMADGKKRVDEGHAKAAAAAAVVGNAEAPKVEVAKPSNEEVVKAIFIAAYCLDQQ